MKSHAFNLGVESPSKASNIVSDLKARFNTAIATSQTALLENVQSFICYFNNSILRRKSCMDDVADECILQLKLGDLGYTETITALITCAPNAAIRER